ncbi:MAG TPA: DUF1465 family protein [Sphingobium sp.]|nr:DUF1465 family protein [Sphingobium sp.]
MSDSKTLVSHFDRRLIDGLYVEAMVLADEARSFFDGQGEEQRRALGEVDRVVFAGESLKVTTRLMHVIAWLLAQRAILNGELTEAARSDERFKLGEAAPTAASIAQRFSPDMTALIVDSADIYQRIARLERQLVTRTRRHSPAQFSPARALLDRLERAF